LFEDVLIGPMKGEKPWVAMYDSVYIVTAVVIRQSSRYRTTASVML
jgi:hypothetical protein